MVQVFAPVMADMRGAVMTEDLYRNFQVMTAQAERRAVAQAMKAVDRTAPGRMQQRHMLGK